MWELSAEPGSVCVCAFAQIKVVVKCEVCICRLADAFGIGADQSLVGSSSFVSARNCLPDKFVFRFVCVALAECAALFVWIKVRVFNGHVNA